MLNLRRILVPTDFSESAEIAQAQANHLAERHQADLHALHVTRAPDSSDLASCTPLTDWVRHQAPQVTPAVRRAEAAVEGILQYADSHDVDVIVMGTHGRRGMRDALLGSTTERVVRRARAPVLTVRAGTDRGATDRLHRILVPIDFSEPSRSLIAHARHVAATWQAEVTLLYVVEEPHFPHFFHLDAHRADLPTLAARAKSELEALAQATGGPEVPLRSHVLTGDPASTIGEFAAAQAFDLILTATHGWTGLQRFMIGSVAEQVVRTAPCPVLTIKGYGQSLVERATAPDAAQGETAREEPSQSAALSTDTRADAVLAHDA
jgi:nucleotide-binding universal stress UspA family protein